MLIKKKTKGFNEKVNLKLPDNSKNEFKVMLRIMEKMFREIRSKKQVLIKNLDNILDNMDNVTIDAVIHEIIGVWTN
jgi:arsenate reductase-like glutaredoxin family protein